MLRFPYLAATIIAIVSTFFSFIAPLGAEESPFEGKAWAVVIGINDYKKAPRLHYAVQGATAVGNLLEQQGFTVIRLVSPKDTLRRSIESELGTKLPKKLSSNDRVLVFFSGHGKDVRFGEGQRQGYLLPIEADPDDLDSTAISMSRVRDWANFWPAKHVLFIVDSCYSGIVGEQTKNIPAMTDQYLRQITREKGRHLIAAGGADQEALEVAEWEQSLLTHFLLDGLRERTADLNHDGIIPTSELYQFLDSRVFAEAQLRGQNQRPEHWSLSPGHKGEFVFMPPLGSFKDGAPMVRVPAGSFMMGSTEGDADEKPVHRVSLDAFYLDKYEVTNKRFQQFVRETGYRTTAEKEGNAYGLTSNGQWEAISGANWRTPEGGETVFVSNRGDHPVVAVSWHDAEAYCRWAGKRLPTEAEFEYANRAGTRTTYWWGEGNPGARRVANIADEAAKRQFSHWAIMAGYDDGYVRTAPVGSFEANPFGLHDMTGNVWEWVADWYDEHYYGKSPERNPNGPSTGQYRVLRGGSWDGRAAACAFSEPELGSSRVPKCGRGYPLRPGRPLTLSPEF